MSIFVTESKRREQLFPSLTKPFRTMHHFKSDITKHFYDEKFMEEQSNAEEYFKSKKKTSKSFEMWADSDEEFKAELENAVKMYKKNFKENEAVKKESDLYKSPRKCIKESKAFDNIDFREEKSKDINGEVNSNGNCAMDVHELINYFFLYKEDKSERPTNKIDYEKQGAIPKRKMATEKYNQRDRNQGETKNAQNDKKLKTNKNQRKVQKVAPFESQQGINEDSINYIFIKQSDSDDCIVKVSEDCCSKPFFYIVPENPTPNFFLSRGSYYVIPKTPSSADDDRVVFHPEKDAECDLNSRALNPKMKFKEPPNVKQNAQVGENNLGKKVLRKVDSHLNIGPTDVKHNDSDNNLETNYDLNKNFNKSFANSPNYSNVFEKERKVYSDLLIEPEIENSNSAEEITPNEERIRLQQLDKVLQILLSEFPNLDEDSAKVIANEYYLDENGLKNYIASTHLTQKIENQLEKMVFALPEHNWDELRDKCNEFQGDDELVENYIKEAQKVNKIRQQLLDMQFVFPDADPEFLRQKIENLNGNEEAFNNLIDLLLDDKNYPKISEDSLNTERRRWWQMYVEKFNVKNFLLKIPNPENFQGPKGNNNPADRELVVKFLRSRYPSKSQDFLIQAYELNNRNLTVTCNSFNGLPLIRLSKSSFRNEKFTEAFLDEICYIDNKKEIDDYLKDLTERKEIEKEEARLNNSFLYCPLCYDDELIASEAVCCLEGHLFCKFCIKRYILLKMSEGVFKFACPSDLCDTSFSYATLQQLLPENVLSNIINKQQAEEINSAKVDGLESCPYCEFAYIPNPEDKIFKCQNSTCLIETCRLCHEKNHIPLRCEEIERSVDVEARKKIEESMTQELVRICPKCQKKFVKIDGCNRMSCVCGTVMCYICRAQISGYEGHFQSYGGKCPLYSNNATLHTTDVYEAGIRTREEILRTNQDVRILYDPTQNKTN